ncbi:hypothetical protein GCM10023081_08630 [Arthrobacter ginkgonis]|uniref:Lipopolysaccharide assembly protein A domain-containing protein n=1 Tax=Arthrobacter ginkgonis TaxID=1630594 RepID=A0ABP7C0J1_9MICC
MTSENPSPSVGPGPAGAQPEPSQTPVPVSNTDAVGSAPAERSSGSLGRPATGQPTPAPTPEHASRTAMAWGVTILGLVLLVLLIVFIAQNQVMVPLKYFGFDGTVNLGLALLVAAVTGGFVVAAVGGARILKLRGQARGTGGRTRRPR